MSVYNFFRFSETLSCGSSIIIVVLTNANSFLFQALDRVFRQSSERQLLRIKILLFHLRFIIETANFVNYLNHSTGAGITLTLAQNNVRKCLNCFSLGFCHTQCKKQKSSTCTHQFFISSVNISKLSILHGLSTRQGLVVTKGHTYLNKVCVSMYKLFLPQSHKGLSFILQQFQDFQNSSLNIHKTNFSC